MDPPKRVLYLYDPISTVCYLSLTMSWHWHQIVPDHFVISRVRNWLSIESFPYLFICEIFVTGDNRGGFYTTLGTWHSIFIRFHNNVATRLRVLNKHWKDERLFQESRRIITAVYHNIAYNEWLPYYIGELFCEIYPIWDHEIYICFVFISQVQMHTNVMSVVIPAVRIAELTIPPWILVIWTNLLTEPFDCSTPTHPRMLAFTIRASNHI